MYTDPHSTYRLFKEMMVPLWASVQETKVVSDVRPSYQGLRLPGIVPQHARCLFSDDRLRSRFGESLDRSPGAHQGFSSTHCT